MKKRNIRTLILLALAVIVLLGLYFLKEYNRKAIDTSDRKADYSLPAEQLIGAFSSSEQQANQQYLDKVIEVSGSVKSIDKDDHGLFTVSIGDPSYMSSVRCNMDSAHNAEAASLIKGASVTIKGVCTGYNADELLGSDVLLSRSVLIQKK